MSRSAAAILLSLSACLATACLAADTDPFVVDELLEGVWLFRAPGDPAGHTNALVIERDAGLLVTEAQPTPEAARRLLRAIGTVSKKPVQYLVLSQANAESTGGVSAFPEQALVIASAVTHDVLADAGSDLSGTAKLRAPDPAAWTAPPRVLPELLLTSATHLTDGRHRIDLVPVLRGHHAGFMMLRIEAEGFFYVGSMVSPDRNPHADPKLSNMGAWLSTLNSVSLARPSWIVPQRGEPIDVEQLRRFRDSLAWVLGQVENAFVEGVPVEDVIRFAMDSPKLAEYFDLEAEPSFVRSLFEKALAEAVERRRKYSER